jgi:1,4-alpha-glucan branching enzyme
MATVPGMPLIYTGQESNLNKALEFFEKDLVDWADYSLQEFFRTLLNLKKTNKSMWNGSFGGDLIRVNTDRDEAVFAFTREKDGDAVFVVLNLSGTAQQFSLSGNAYAGNYTNVFDGKQVAFVENQKLQLEPWEFLVYSKKK